MKFDQTIRSITYVVVFTAGTKWIGESKPFNTLALARSEAKRFLKLNPFDIAHIAIDNGETTTRIEHWTASKN